MGKIRHELWLLGKAEMTAGVASIVDFGLAIALCYSGLLPYNAANLIGVMSGGVTNCALNRRYVFTHTTHSRGGVAWRYFVVWLFSMTFNGLGTNHVTALVGTQWFLVVKCCIAVVVAIGFNYPLQRNFVFK